MIEIPPFLQKSEITQRIIPVRSKLHVRLVHNTFHNLVQFLSRSHFQWYHSQSAGFFQILNPSLKIILFLLFVVCAGLTHDPSNLFMIAFVVPFLMLTSGLSLLRMYKKIFLLSFFFGFIPIAPAMLNIFSKGDLIFTLLDLGYRRKFWIYEIPAQIGITREGLILGARVFLKVTVSISFGFLLVYTTSFDQIVKSLRALKVSSTFLSILLMSYKFIFLASRSLTEAFLALKMRWFQPVNAPKAREIITDRMGYTFRQSWQRYLDTYRAMTARGFKGKITYPDQSKWMTIDYITLTLSLLLLTLNFLI